MANIITNLEDVKFIEEQIINDPAASYWLKQQIKESSNRDILDVLNDVDILRSILSLRHDAIKISSQKGL
ncbi:MULTISPECIES: hypothetical protein [unclassified Pseudoalteromonas]|uniref:hypothetical protein n=1 Tax=unclassified Pseudoalteromonas TaxID=194690 RepID=UPI0023580F58|nr:MULTISPECIES: hypothetical protein [unclassified Pseudoalteromonas]MDC9563416.1 hypothetical protein [Pseudoalteromonas sp. GAB2316C]MDC9572102.1 hypothetical protein [Pseudoalteromonas sp. GABNS16A]MDC9583863.1 hypothetical protein [Pseudoalteromonas sp. GABNS16C]MDC9607740.1 hypothetical protein [Pseudoalteromonas sp. GABNS16H]